ncbi:hypothetical protein DL93DRAFT_2083269 [Clavulina sp. PMI_390]|nr:hypothetical protein DL93DRAFT_2083269 [Clavulina sp. PMI_390]
MELFQYYAAQHYTPEIVALYQGPIPAERPRRQWDVYNGDDGNLLPQSWADEQLSSNYEDDVPEHWAEFSFRW